MIIYCFFCHRSNGNASSSPFDYNNTTYIMPTYFKLNYKSFWWIYTQRVYYRYRLNCTKSIVVYYIHITRVKYIFCKPFFHFPRSCYSCDNCIHNYRYSYKTWLYVLTITDYFIWKGGTRLDQSKQIQRIWLNAGDPFRPYNIRYPIFNCCNQIQA